MRVRWLLLALALGALLVWWLLPDGRPQGGAGPVGDAPPPGRAPVLDVREAPPAAPTTPRAIRGDETIRGRVEDADGNPLAGVQVVLEREEERPFLPRAPGRWLETEASGRSPPFARVAATRSGEDGTFALALPTRGSLPPPGSVRLRAEGGPPWAPCTRLLFGLRPDTYVRLTLVRGTPLHVRLVDARDRGIAGTVGGYRERDATAVTSLPCRFDDRPTGSDGRLTLLLPDGTFLFTVRAPGRGQRAGLRVETPQSGEVLLHLGRAGGAALAGRVQDPAGRPVGGARVLAGCEAPSGERQQLLATSAADGSYRIGGLQPGTLSRVRVTAPGFVPAEVDDSGRELVAGKTTRFDLILVRGGVLEGVVRAPSGRGLAGAEVRARAEPPTPGLAGAERAVTDAGGHYRMTEVPPGAGRVQVAAPGWYQPHPGRDRYVMSGSAPRQRVDVTLARGVPVAGRVVDASGHPVAGATVTVAGRPITGWWPRDPAGRTATSDAAGRFTLAGLPPGVRWSLTARAEDALSLPVVVAVRPEAREVADVEIVVRPCAAIAGRVTCQGRAVTETLRVQARARGGAYGVTPLRADGSYRIPGLRPGTYEVAVVNGGLATLSSPRSVRVDWGDAPEDVDLEMPPRGVVAGVVVDTRGEPVPGVTLRLEVPAWGATSSGDVRTDAQGRFLLPDVPDTGEGYALWLEGRRLPGTHRAGETDLRLVHEPPAEVRFQGTVLLPDGTPAAKGPVVISERAPDGSARDHQTPIADGAFALSFRPRASGSTFRAEVREVFDGRGGFVDVRPAVLQDVRPGEPLVVRLQAGLAIQGVVVDPDGAPVPDVPVALWPAGDPVWFHRKNMATRADGSFHFGALQEGDYEIQALHPPAPWVAPAAVSLHAGDHEVRVTLRRGGAVRGRVLDPDGAPVPDAVLTWRPATGPAVTARSDPAGTFELSPLPPAAAGTLVGSPPRGARLPMLPVVREGVRAGTGDLELRLARGALIEGEVAGPDGEALPQVTVSVAPLDPSGSRDAPVRVTGGTHFVIGPLAAGRYRLGASAAGDYAASEPATVEAPAGDVHLTVPRGLALQGTLVGSEAPETFDVTFFLPTPRGTAACSGTVAASGRFRVVVRQDAPGTLLFRSREGGTLCALVEDARPSAGPLRVRLQPGLSIGGRVEDLGPGETANVVVSAANGLSLAVPVAADGSFQVAGLPAGRYQVGGVLAGRTIEAVRDVRAGTRDLVLRAP